MNLTDGGKVARGVQRATPTRRPSTSCTCGNPGTRFRPSPRTSSCPCVPLSASWARPARFHQTLMALTAALGKARRDQEVLLAILTRLSRAVGRFDETKAEVMRRLGKFADLRKPDDER